MEDIIMGGTAEANESHGFLSSEAFTASSGKQSVNDVRKNAVHAGPDSLQKTEEENRAFEQRVHKLFIDLGDEIGVDLLLLSGSEDDPEVLAVKALWIERNLQKILGGTDVYLMPLVTMPGRSWDGRMLLIAGLVDPSESSGGDEKLATKKAEETGAAGADRVDVNTENTEEA
ncbi:hypothetical protein G7Y79_00016g040840 [Physcia stellaris]|nr:hypothetical protein G7Y79_00016g040840 [Physcia stellaris]